MTNFELFTLHPESKIIPIAQLSPTMRARIEGADAAFVLSRSSARGGAIVLDQFGGRLVESFRDGGTFPQNLKRVAEEFGVDSNVVVKEAYPLLRRLVRDRHLIKRDAEDTSAAPGVGRALMVGDVFRGYRVEARIQELDDTAVYKVLVPGGGYGALKLLRKPDVVVGAAFAREAQIVRHLGGENAPRLIEAQVGGPETFLVLEWVDGYTLVDWAARARNLPRDERFVELRRMVTTLFEAYKSLHERGVLHSDIWSKNIVIDHAGQIRILDFGLAWFPPANEVYGIPKRANHPYFRAPDLARAEREQLERPAPTIAAEIYSLGVLCYLVITGKHYIDFSIEADAQLREVCHEKMLTFEERGAPAWSEMEALIERMVRKDPTERFGSLGDCLAALADVPIPTQADSVGVGNGGTDPIPFLRSYVGERFEKPFIAPSASLFLGMGGLAYCFLRAARALREPSLIAEAEYTAVCARRWMDAGPDGSTNPRMEITDETTGRHSILHRSEGVALVEGVLAHALGDVGALRTACLRYLSGVHREAAPVEFAFGKAGLLNGFRQLAVLVEENAPLVAGGDELADDILAELEGYGGIAASRLRYIGFAHGWVGVLYALLAWGGRFNARIVERCLPFIAELEGMKVEGKLGGYWPRHLDQSAEAGDTPSWCNGAAGCVLLWSEAYTSTGDDRWLRHARDAGRLTALHHDQEFSLCCGLAGRAFCLGHLGRVSGEQEWFNLAEGCLERARPYQGNFIHSLFQGIPGLELARAELRRPEFVTFPLLATDLYGAPLSVGRLKA